MTYGNPCRPGLARLVLALSLLVPLSGCEVVALSALLVYQTGYGVASIPGAIVDEIHEPTDPALVRAHAGQLDKALCGDKKAQGAVARNYKEGRGTGYDFKEAYFWSSLAAQQKVGYAASLRDELGGQLKPRERAETDIRVEEWVPRDCPKAKRRDPARVQYLVDLEKASCGDGAAQFAVAKHYNFGQGTEKDPKEAFFWISVAENRGLEGVAYYHDHLGKRLAPEVRAEIDVRVEAWAPRDCPTNTLKVQRRTWHLLELDWASCGNTWAQLWVAEDYQTGRGIEKDLKESYFWYSLAAKYWGSRLAALGREEVAQEITPEERAEIDIRVKEWIPGDCPTDIGKAQT